MFTLTEFGEDNLLAASPEQLKNLQKEFNNMSEQKKSSYMMRVVRSCVQECLAAFKIAGLEEGMFEAFMIEAYGEPEFFSFEFKRITKEQFDNYTKKIDNQ